MLDSKNELCTAIRELNENFFLVEMSYRDHSKTVADNGFFRFMTHCPTVGSNVKNRQKID